VKEGKNTSDQHQSRAKKTKQARHHCAVYCWHDREKPQVPIRELAAKHDLLIETIHTIFTDNVALVKKSTRQVS
jgi:hypothetical protein